MSRRKDKYLKISNNTVTIQQKYTCKGKTTLYFTSNWLKHLMLHNLVDRFVSYWNKDKHIYVKLAIFRDNYILCHVTMHIHLESFIWTRWLKSHGPIWINDLQYFVLFNSISVISSQWKNYNKRLCAVEPCLYLERFPPTMVSTRDH